LDGDAPNAKIEITNFTYNNKDEIFNFVEEIQKKIDIDLSIYPWSVKN
jgi:hypothetical protein